MLLNSIRIVVAAKVEGFSSLSLLSKWQGTLLILGDS